ncbi:Uncharacterized protein PECH_008022 [Penicillium ucsense]|uniref:Uncharacterized protein n=1 Tax=Penicillium ucsense TaxID=2839758 RepID=A0A8J8WG54_9EURO|nr:Uncharacterized protein PECM_007800 [Penicillium ucsense]KAF7734433.1 Uncharacterized protein PECH_008022 [Penicillium ucsense]
MSFLAGLCSCFSSGDVQPQVAPSRPEMQMRSSSNVTPSGVQTGSYTYNDRGEVVRIESPLARRLGHGPSRSDLDSGGYASVVPLPQYTPRPMSVHEKTLEAHLRDAPVSSDSSSVYQDEKRRQAYEDEATSDNSSVFSYPSSFGNTSTATRETPPPPYSPRGSMMIGRSRTASISSTMDVAVHPPPLARLHGACITAVPSEADDQSIRRHRRHSWQSR